MTSTAQAIIKFNSYLSKDDEVPMSTNIIQYWKNHEFKELAEMALKLLIIPASSVASERDCSTAEYTINKRRTRLTPIRVKKILFLNRNLRFVPSPVDDVSF